MWIKSIEIEGFRGYPKKRIFNFDLKPFIFIFGNNKCGKSSLLNAIEWVIFGSNVGTEKHTKIPERKDWEFKNFNSSKTKVILTLEDSKKNVVAEVIGKLIGKEKAENYLKIIGQEENYLNMPPILDNYNVTL